MMEKTVKFLLTISVATVIIFGAIALENHN